MFSSESISLAISDGSAHLSLVRSRLSAIQSQTASAPENNEDDRVILRKSVRYKGFEEADHVVPTGATAPGGGHRRASLSASGLEKTRNRIIRAFNVDFKKGLKLMRENGFYRTAPETARFLLHTGGLDRVEVGKALGSFTDERGMEALRLFAEGIEMEGLEFLPSLRKYLAKFKLPGESQMVDRILEAFAAAFLAANPLGSPSNRTEFPDSGAVHLLSFAVIMLNTDMYNKSLQKNKKMTKKQFVANTMTKDPATGATNFEQAFLETIYTDISRKEIVHTETKHDEGNLFHDAVKEGWMKKKSDSMPYQWQQRFFILTKNPGILYYFATEDQVNPTGYIPLEMIAVRKTDDKVSKKGLELVPDGISAGVVKSVKYGSKGALEQGNHDRFLFKAESVEEAWEWIRMINVVMGEEAGGGGRGSVASEGEAGVE
ncbi:hypothetical protein TeGR_g15189 [Tetraparma gracilis]|uniref:Uncharacterized protein n=1 Tax=Tetraparma gracilis TaxID=2962635 RepID=A0ABQ6MCT3_9STRA|nr:hypothetical protein TeGR_g15189 [Tetraparma gracilis]